MFGLRKAADEWLGKGALASLRFAQEGQVRLPACLQAVLRVDAYYRYYSILGTAMSL